MGDHCAFPLATAGIFIDEKQPQTAHARPNSESSVTVYANLKPALKVLCTVQVTSGKPHVTARIDFLQIGRPDRPGELNEPSLLASCYVASTVTVIGIAGGCLGFLPQWPLSARALVLVTPGLRSVP